MNPWRHRKKDFIGYKSEVVSVKTQENTSKPSNSLVFRTITSVVTEPKDSAGESTNSEFEDLQRLIQHKQDGFWVEHNKLYVVDLFAMVEDDGKRKMGSAPLGGQRWNSGGEEALSPMRRSWWKTREDCEQRRGPTFLGRDHKETTNSIGRARGSTGSRLGELEEATRRSEELEGASAKLIITGVGLQVAGMTFRMRNQ
ncbi:hypothetical protein KSP39_PZI007568 [Platanthera zijinensis]|uniref:Uncharacterized protein n=1 Tax=Platanthera zijinensis TaxID=2320716 RepID=A0AAP0G9C3_9ASPA